MQKTDDKSNRFRVSFRME